MKLNVLYISSACSEKTFSYLEDNRIEDGFVYGMPVAANKFHNLFMQGFVSNDCDVTAFSGLPISSRSHSKKIWHKTTTKENGVNYLNLPFINMPIIKHLCIGFSCLKNIRKWSKRKGNKIVIYDAAYVSLIPFIIFACRILKIKTFAIFSDIYDYMYDVDTKNTNYHLLGKISRKMMRHCYNKTYAYIFLSSQMNDLINKKGKPFCVIEGIASSKLINIKKIKKTSKKVLMYAGALRKEYGLEILVKGFMDYHDDDAQLWIYGKGDYLEEIKKMSEKDKRIIYQGVKSNQEIVEIEKKVTLLINPRPSNLEFAKYSFPSKLMEYMSSKNPVLTTKLPTIPKEYYDYLLFIENETKEGVTEALYNTFKMDMEKLNKYGEKAQEFILNNKIEKIQVKKIIDLYEVK